MSINHKKNLICVSSVELCFESLELEKHIRICIRVKNFSLGWSINNFLAQNKEKKQVWLV
jgi:hypothetical protein